MLKIVSIPPTFAHLVMGIKIIATQKRQPKIQANNRFEDNNLVMLVVHLKGALLSK